MSILSPSLFYLILGAGLIAIELLVMAFSVFWFLFFGIGAIITAFVAWFAPELGWKGSTLIFLASSIAVSFLLYKPIKKWQNKPSPIAGNNAIGQSVKVTVTVTSQNSGKALWSGSEWVVELDQDEQDIAAGDTAVIRKIEGICLIVGR